MRKLEENILEVKFGEISLILLCRLQAQSSQPKRPYSGTATWKSQEGATAINYDQMKKEMEGGTPHHNVRPSSANRLPKTENRSTTSKNLAVASVLYICPCCPMTLPKSEMNDHLLECLKKELDSEPLMIAVTMIHSLNKGKTLVDGCIHILGQYLQNIIDHPGEEKYRKIRRGNKTFQKKVAPLIGVEDFLLKGVGFELMKLPQTIDGETSEHEFYVLNDAAASNTEQLTVAKQMLLEAEPLEITLDRNVRVFEPSSIAKKIELPSDFYSVTSAEIQKEQIQRTTEIEKSQQLRTKAMREADSNPKRNYPYTLLRIRFPDGILLQGTFSSGETLDSVRKFIQGHLHLDWMPFTLVDSIGKSFTDESATLQTLKLAPSALLNFLLDSSVGAEIASSSPDGKIKYLKDEYLMLIQHLDSPRSS